MMHSYKYHSAFQRSVTGLTVLYSNLETTPKGEGKKKESGFKLNLHFQKRGYM